MPMGTVWNFFLDVCKATMTKSCAYILWRRLGPAELFEYEPIAFQVVTRLSLGLALLTASSSWVCHAG